MKMYGYAKSLACEGAARRNTNEVKRKGEKTKPGTCTGGVREHWAGRDTKIDERPHKQTGKGGGRVREAKGVDMHREWAK
jgi:hypothetical protein